LKVLIIEDSFEVAEAVSLCLQVRWPQAKIAVAPEGNRGLKMLKADKFDIVILDINLPDIDGFEVLKQMRLFSDVPTIILTVREKEDEQVAGLEIGADDYIVKPFRPRDLVARVNAILRRIESPRHPQEQHSVYLGKLILNLTNNKLQIGDLEATLTPTESRLLYTLMENAERTVSNEKISQAVWGKDSANTEPVRTYIRRLRDKLHDNPARIILTEHGEGYRLVTPK